MPAAAEQSSNRQQTANNKTTDLDGRKSLDSIGAGQILVARFIHVDRAETHDSAETIRGFDPFGGERFAASTERAAARSTREAVSIGI